MKTELYPAMEAALANAQRRVRVTYLQPNAPLESPNKGERDYHEALRRAIPERKDLIFQRLIGVDSRLDSAPKNAWVEGELASAAIAANYDVKFVALQTPPAMNVAIFDEHVFLIDPCRSNDSAQPRDIHVSAAPDVADLLDRYFSALWFAASDLKPTGAGLVPADQPIDVGTTPLLRILRSLTAGQVWGAVVAIAAVLGGAFALGRGWTPVEPKEAERGVQPPAVVASALPDPAAPFEFWLPVGESYSFFGGEVNVEVMVRPQADRPSKIRLRCPGVDIAGLLADGSELSFPYRDRHYVLRVVETKPAAARLRVHPRKD